VERKSLPGRAQRNGRAFPVQLLSATREGRETVFAAALEEEGGGKQRRGRKGGAGSYPSTIELNAETYLRPVCFEVLGAVHDS